MPYKIFKTYQIILDKKLKDSTFMIFIIALLILITGIIVPNTSLASSKANIFEIQKQNNRNFQTIIELNGKKYKLYLEELK